MNHQNTVAHVNMARYHLNRAYHFEFELTLNYKLVGSGRQEEVMFTACSNRFSRKESATLMRWHVAICVAVAGGFLSIVPHVGAADQVSTFRNGTGNWSNPNSWSPSGVPNNGASTYDAVFNGQYGVSSGDTLKLDENVTINQFTMSGGFLAPPDSGGPYTLTLNGALNWSGGIIGGVNLTANAGGTISANSACIFEAGTLQNAGTITYTTTLPIVENGPFSIRMDANAVINNLTGATFNFADDGGIGSTSSTAQINNQGTFEKSAGTGISQVMPGFNNAATVLVQSGTLEFLGGTTTDSGTDQVSAGATLAFDSGIHTFTSAATLGGGGTLQFGGDDVEFNGKLLGGAGGLQVVGGQTTFNPGSDVSSLGIAPAQGGRALKLVGQGTTLFNTGHAVNLASLTTVNVNNNPITLGGSDDFVLNGPAVWNDGTISGPLTSPNNTLSVNAGLTISGLGMNLDHRNLVNNSTVTWTDGFIQAKNGAVITNPAGSTFNIQADNGVQWGPAAVSGALPSFNNAGLIVKSAGTGETAFMDVRMTNTGTIQVNSGTLSFYHSGYLGSSTGYADTGVNSGTYQIGQGATMIVSDHTMTASSTVQGAGTMQFEGNNNTVAGNYNITGTTAAYGGVTFQPGSAVTSVGQLLNVASSGGVVFSSGNPITLHDLILNGSLGGSDSITVTGKMSGAGTMSSNVVAPGVISPGNSPGILTNQGNLTMEHSTMLNMEMAGNSNANQVLYDVVNSSGQLTISGTLVLNLIDGYVPAPIDKLAIITSTTPLDGLFDNVLPDQRLMTADGTGSFLVNYGASSPFGADEVVLNNFQAVPEPTGFALLLMGAAAVLSRPRRRL